MLHDVYLSDANADPQFRSPAVEWDGVALRAGRAETEAEKEEAGNEAKKEEEEEDDDDDDKTKKDEDEEEEEEEEEEEGEYRRILAIVC